MKNFYLMITVIALSACSFAQPPASDMDPETDPSMDEEPEHETQSAPAESCMSGDTRSERCRSDCPSGESYLACTGSTETSFSWQCLCEPLESPSEEPEPDHVCDPGTIRLGDCAEECTEGSSFRACLATGDDFAWQCVVHNPARCMGEEGSPEPEPEAQDRVVIDDPSARIVVTVAGLDQPVRVSELAPVNSDYTVGGEQIEQATLRARFRESDGRLRFQIWQNGRPLSGISGGECVTVVDYWQLGTHDEATGEAVECYPELVDGVCAFTIPRYYDLWSWNSMDRFLENARFQLGLEDPPSSCTPTTEICGDGIDQDCDGLDRSCPPSSACDGDPLIGASCHDGIGECRRDGHFVCDESSAARECSVSAAAASTETCNGLDDDCDGVADEGGVCSVSMRRLRVEMRVTDTSAVTWGTTRDHSLVNDDGFVVMTCLNTGSTAMQSIGGGWYRCEVDVPTGASAKFVGRFHSDRPEHSGWLHSASDWGSSSSCYGTDGVTVRVFDSAGSLMSTSLGYGVAGGCRHIVP